mmetsp:Transcript_26429/g.57953  ORF Transcript_26429/g.57953 Transcript_26429/m.57953 type:complete len:298 (-) Transcript_26429:147-1040(-)|eukprot:CAMPEP_0178499702 /NCGR_PEP_ID=MMETSP0696-20121128/15965_1 /TAXON_ID=265572 /ORGANISM="Extubocellulus spinifer, Strain CCMP396" /LENGTH=297 /DNA_ID=CAMNT_0020128417 /DNA_START=119 /DNA_END=1012 /DNA_ORIENTATION=-
MICSKSSLLSLLLVLNQASGFAPSSARRLTSTTCAAAGGTTRIPTAIHYVNDPDSVSISKKRKQHPKKRRYELLSNNISQLTASSSTDDVIKAIKRACNLKSIHDIEVIGSFLLEGVDDSFGYGYKGSLLARFAVAALRLNEHDLARRAMQMRRERFAESMTSFESAAVLRGLLRAHKIDEAFELLEEELSVVPGDADRLKHRSQALASIVSRHFFHNEPEVAIRACRMLAELGPVVVEAGLTAEEVDMPWYRVLLAADQCKINVPHHEYDEAVVGAMREYPLDDAFQLVFKRLSEK